MRTKSLTKAQHKYYQKNHGRILANNRRYRKRHSTKIKRYFRDYYKDKSHRARHNQLQARAIRYRPKGIKYYHNHLVEASIKRAHNRKDTQVKRDGNNIYIIRVTHKRLWTLEDAKKHVKSDN